MNKTLTEKRIVKKGETWKRINPKTTKFILTQKYAYHRKAIDIWRDISDRCSYGYVCSVIKNPVAYVGMKYFLEFDEILNKLEN
jgi:hypothetical protein